MNTHDRSRIKVLAVGGWIPLSPISQGEDKTPSGLVVVHKPKSPDTLKRGRIVDVSNMMLGTDGLVPSAHVVYVEKEAHYTRIGGNDVVLVKFEHIVCVVNEG